MLSPRFAESDGPIPANLRIEQIAKIKNVSALISEDKWPLVPQSCPCGVAPASDEIEIARRERYGLRLRTVLCFNCGTLRFNPYLGEKTLKEFYTCDYQEMYGRSTDLAEYFERQRTYGRRIVITLRRSSDPKITSILEVGCGAGGALLELQNAGYAVAGFDYSSELVAAGKENGVRNIFAGNFEDASAAVDNRSFDCILLHHVLEHVSDPTGLLRRLKQLLNPGGRIWIAVPDFTRIHEFSVPNGDLLQFLHIAHKFNFTFECFEAMAHQCSAKACLLAIDHTTPTPWSLAPELWIEIRFDDNGKGVRRRDETMGDIIWNYLQRVETEFAQRTIQARRHTISGKLKHRWLRFAGKMQ
jgi:2-polyprenyl-3-methyl-5-hydroxy-6-metoxy-1,4-benzoquinol methylase